MLRTLLTVGGWTMVSRVLGLLRDQMLARYLGAGPTQDALLVAFRLPNMFRSLFGEGAFNAAFVPIFTAKLERDGHDEARRFAASVMGALTGWLLFLAILGEIFMPWVVRLLASGFTVGGERFDLVVTLSRITFPYLVLICIAALAAGVLNALNRFTMAAAAYASFNVVGIVSILIGAYWLGDTALCSAWGLTISGVVQLGLLLWSARRAGIVLVPGLPRLTATMRDMLKRLGFGLIGSSSTQINLVINTNISSYLPAGSIGWIYFADRLTQLPLGVLGAAAGTTLLPALARHAARNETPEGHAALNNAIDYTALLTLPACIGLIALAPEIMAGLFGYGHFTTHDVIASSQSLTAYAFGLPAFVLLKLLTPGFYAHGDTRTPVMIGFLSIGLNLVLNLLFFRPLAHVGPPLASALAATVQAGVFGVILHRRNVFRPSPALLARLGKMGAASVIMGCVAWVAARHLTPGLVAWPGLARISALAALIGMSGALYLLLLALMGIAAPRGVLRRLRRR
ncbi:murein biosynthesis integral membrane protein MurJ [Acidomonas methanolica]|uniref:murein biosynthesis integral membrane protein MurJ n=1 Tax=Acidomonas methanolica TaxID=437 RepID=UPI00211A47D0|nr:murein biosynthesis integral membrane protein MurJ [Acidomonas methanolica]MCQ9154908.1 murein biosynthesis integral membrane protein MurJ [Acidomonas methanolica]